MNEAANSAMSSGGDNRHAWMNAGVNVDAPRGSATGDRGPSPSSAAPTQASTSPMVEGSGTYLHSWRAAVTRSLLGVPFLFLAVVVPDGFDVFLLLGLLLGGLPWLRRFMHSLYVGPDGVTQVRSLFTRRVSGIEAAKIEGVETNEGLIGQLLDYGYLVVTGSGGKRIVTTPLDDPAAVAELIRATARASQDAAPHPAPATAAASLDRLAALDEALRRLVRLRDDGLLTDAEFDAQKARFLSA